MKSPSAHLVRLFALAAVLPTMALAGLALTSKQTKRLLAHGPLIEAHSDVACEACHVASPGSMRQQIQAQVQYALGRRETRVDFGYQPVSSTVCLACHARPNERHPIYRFQEPRFAQALQSVEARSCLGCHFEHGEQVVSSRIDVCRHCHEDIKVKNDPLDVAHENLIAQQRWESCLGCHDFHGNHVHKAPRKLADAVPAEVIRKYFLGQESPYGSKKRFEARAP